MCNAILIKMRDMTWDGGKTCECADCELIHAWDDLNDDGLCATCASRENLRSVIEAGEDDINSLESEIADMEAELQHKRSELALAIAGRENVQRELEALEG